MVFSIFQKSLIITFCKWQKNSAILDRYLEKKIWDFNRR